MESTIKEIRNLLDAVVATMDEIDVRGIENQNKFVSCANAIKGVCEVLEQFEVDHNLQDESTGRREDAENG